MTLRGHLLIALAVSALARYALADSCTPAALGGDRDAITVARRDQSTMRGSRTRRCAPDRSQDRAAPAGGVLSTLPIKAGGAVI